MDTNPRIGTQLISPKDAKASKLDNNKDSDKELNDDGDVMVGEQALEEFSAVGGGAVAGFSAPLGGKKHKR